MNSGRVLFALARYFDWWANRMVTEFELDGGRADLLVVSKAGYATEVEIKVSRADWKADAAKAKWGGDRPHVARFFYAVPASLLEAGQPDRFGSMTYAVPAFVPPACGVLAIIDGGLGYDSVREVRAAPRFKAQRLPPERLRDLDAAFYYRFWRQLMTTMHVRISAEKERTRKVAA